MNTLQITTSFKKEIWEYEKTLFWVPVIVGIMILVLPVIQFVLLEDYQHTRILDHLAELQHVESNDYISKGFQAAVLGMSMPFILIALILQVQYFISCFYDERRDLSSYFWRSMPVPDAQSILVKLVHGAFVIPAIFMLAATATLVLVLILALIFCVVLSVGYDISLWGLWGNAGILTSLVAQWINIIPYAIWMFPVFAWLMLASMFANKVPFLWATLPVVIIMLVEAFIVEYFDLSHGMILETLKGYFNFAFRNGVYHIDDVNSVGFLMTKALFSKIELGASLLGCGFVYIAYLLRVKRN